MNDDPILTFGAWASGFAHRLAFLATRLALLGVVVVVALLAGWLLRIVLGRVLALLRFDRLAGTVGLTALLRRAGLNGEPSGYAARVVAWIAVLVFVLAGTATVGIPGTANVVDRAIVFIPSLVAALFVLVAGMLLAEFISRGVLITAVNAGWRGARLVSGSARVLVLLLTAAMALEELHIAPGVVTATFSILLGGVVFSVGLAFGLAGRDVARTYLERNVATPPKDEAGSEMDHV
jgi:hypothetical protein